MSRLWSVTYYTGLCAFLLLMGGCLHLLIVETKGPNGPSATEALQSVALWAGLAGVLTVATGLVLARRNRKRMMFGTIWLLILLPLTLYGAEFLFRWFVPAWPAVGLHGVSPETGLTAWAKAAGTGKVGLNDWGQRDRARSIRPSADTYRIAFVGDSFLEESSTIPVSLRVEQKIDRADVEVINLGVSASDPDEYYYRTRNIAIPLGIDHCVMLVFAGNDFTAPERTLTGRVGIVAVYPRGSFFSDMGLLALNHLLTNRDRPVLQAWFAAGDLSAYESNLGQAMAEADDQNLRDLLYSLEHHNLGPAQRHTLAGRLNEPGMAGFFEMLRQPDEGLFRSYYLTAGLWSASVGGGQWAPLSEQSCFHWVQRTDELCRERGVEFTLVVIPEAFHVDPRMCEQWEPLTDMRQLTRACRVAAGRLVTRAADAGIETIDLHPPFDGVGGTYLNLDGHWSDRGVELASDVLARRLSDRVAARRSATPLSRRTVEPAGGNLRLPSE